MKRLPCRTLAVHAAPGTERWALSAEEAAEIACWLSRDVEVYFWPRSQVREVWRKTHGSELPVRPYSFRAWSSGGAAHLFVDDTETPESIRWLLLHELAHLDLVSSPLLARAYRGVKRPANYLTSDDAHEANPEEQMANFVADQLAPRLGIPAGLDRRWWRKRVESRARRSA
jgi:hypothetical protein